MLDQNNFTIVDVETTGGSPFFSRVIEVGLLRIEKGKVVEQYQTLVNPEVEVPEFISRMTGITDSQLVNQPLFSDIAEELLPKFEDAIFVAHNVNFDYSFLKEEFRRSGLSFNSDRLCTVRLSRSLYKEFKHHNLSALIERYGLKVNNRHRAFDDAKVLWDFLQLTANNFSSEEFSKAMKQVTTKSRILKRSSATEDDSSKSKLIIDNITYEPEPGETLNLG